MAKKNSIIIIGAGIAGLSAAEILTSSGFESVTILEARNRIGGRVHVREHDENTIHMGAQWIHQYCPENSMAQVAKKYGMIDDNTNVTGGDMNPDSQSDTDDQVFKSDGKMIPSSMVKKATKIYKHICNLVEGEEESDLIDDSVKNVDQLFEIIAEDGLRKLESKLDEEEYEEVAAALYGNKNALAHFICGPLDDCSLEVYTTGKTLPGGDIDLPHGLLNAIANDLPEGCVKLEHVVTNLDWSSEDEIRVTCKIQNQEDKIFVADHIICTIPIGVLQKNHTSLFTPNLPNWKIKAINGISSGSTNKYFVSWNEPWRPVNDSNIILAWTQEELSNITFPDEWYKGIMEFSAEDSDPDGTLMIAWIGGKSAQVADTLPDDQIIRDLGNILRKFSGNPNIPDPDHLVRECWTSDEFTLGAYSYPKVGSSTDVYKRMGDPVPNNGNPRILFAGEACSKNFW